MSLQHHISETAPGVTGASAVGGFTLMGFITDSIPVLQAASLLIGIAVAIVTFVYYWRKVRKDE
jgi:hypothetical protein